LLTGRLFALQEPEYTDKSVVANKEYQYRVTAENEGGESKPSEPSDLIKAKALKGRSILCPLANAQSMPCMISGRCLMRVLIFSDFSSLYM